MYSIVLRHKKLAALIIAIASVSFLFWMFTVADIKQMFGKKGCVAVVNGECITLREFRYELLRYSDILGDPDVERVVKRQVVSNLVVREIIYQKALDLGLVTSDGEVAETIKRDKTFWEGDRFSLRRYREVLSRFGMTPREYEEYLKRLLTVEKLFRFLSFGVYLTEEERDIERTLKGIRFKGKAYLITEDYVKLRERPKEEELKKFYEENKERFSLPEVREFRVWATERKEEAHSLYRSLKEGRYPDGGKVYRLSGREKPDLPGEVIREMERTSREGGYSITKVGDTYYVIYLERVIPKRYRPFEEIREEIERELLKEKRFEKLREFAEKVKEDLKKGGRVKVRYLSFEDSTVEDLVKLFRVGDTEILKLTFSRERVFGPYRMSTGFAVLVLEGREVKEGGEFKEEDILAFKVRDISDLFIDKLIRDARIDINEEYLR